jgi:8-oxo-dGTP diphosphatase
MKNIVVVAAIIINNNKILCVQRGENKLDYISKKFEFPGGKIEIGETKEEGIIREVLEELNMTIIPFEEFLTVNHQYPDFNLTLHSFLCSTDNPTVTLSEHIDYKWLNKEELLNLDWAAADLPIVAELLKLEI